MDGVASTFSSIEEWSSACGESVWQTCQQTISTIQKRVPSSEAESFSDEVTWHLSPEKKGSSTQATAKLYIYICYIHRHCISVMQLIFLYLTNSDIHTSFFVQLSISTSMCSSSTELIQRCSVLRWPPWRKLKRLNLVDWIWERWPIILDLVGLIALVLSVSVSWCWIWLV